MSARDHDHRHTHSDGETHEHQHTPGEHHGSESGMSSGAMGQGMSRQGEVAVPVSEERLNVEKRQAELGEVQVHKTVTEEQQSVPVELTREEVSVERRDVGDRPLREGETAFQEGTIRVPVRGEEAVVTKEAVVTGEVVINKERTTEQQNVTGTVRREQVEVDKDYEQHRSGFQQHFTQRQGQTGGMQSSSRRWEEAEPNYQWGYSSARDARYQGREFEDVEGDLRNSWSARGQSSGSGAGDSWERLREEVREGWNRARGRA